MFFIRYGSQFLSAGKQLTLDLLRTWTVEQPASTVEPGSSSTASQPEASKPIPELIMVEGGVALMSAHQCSMYLNKKDEIHRQPGALDSSGQPAVV